MGFGNILSGIERQNCNIADCSSYTSHLGMCNKHYLQVRRHGKVTVSSRDYRAAIIERYVAKIPLGVNAKNGYATIDKEYAYLSDDNWYLTTLGYVKRAKDKALLHRVITDCPKGKVVDHKNGDPLDNTTANLRVCTQADNSRNQRRKITNTTGYKGVYIVKGRYKTSIRVNYKNINLGTFDSATEAYEVYSVAAVKYHGEFARLA